MRETRASSLPILPRRTIAGIVEQQPYPYPIDLRVQPKVAGLFDPDTSTISYVVKDPSSSALAAMRGLTGLLRVGLIEPLSVRLPEAMNQGMNT